MSLQNRPKLCFVNLYGYPLFNSDYPGRFGGSEVRIALITRELAKRDRFEVSMVVFDHGQPKVEQREGITFYAHPGYPAPPEPEQFAGKLGPTLNRRQRPRYKLRDQARRLPPQLFKRAQRIYQLFRRVKMKLLFQQAGRIGPYLIEKAKLAIYDDIGADIYLLPGNSHFAAELAYYCRRRGKPYVFLAGSDGDYNPAYKKNPQMVDPYGWSGYLLLYAIEQATAHIAQNRQQVDLLQKYYGRSAIIIKNPLDLTRAYPKTARADTILWVGKSDRIKQPELVLNLARRCPDYQFTVILNISLPDVYEQCVREAKKLPNVTLLPYVPFNQVEQYFAQAKLLINTSIVEGFPNAFLQAAKYGTPVVSLQVDPGEMLSRHGCGLLCNGDFEQLKENAQQLMTTPKLYAQLSARCLAYVRAFHNKDIIITEYERVLTAILNKERIR